MRLAAFAIAAAFFVVALGRAVDYELATAAPPRVHIGDGSLIKAINVQRAKTWRCQRQLSRPLSSVSYAAERSPSLAFRKWTLKLWRGRATFECRAAAWFSSARGRNIAAAQEIAAQGGNPWPNCPDPLRDGASWDATKNCESPGYSWAEDPPGYFCGPLQIDPRYWGHLIRKYGIPC